MLPIKRTTVQVTIKRTGHKPAMIHLPTAEAYMDAVKERAHALVKDSQRRKMSERTAVGRAFSKAASRNRKA